MKKDTLALIPVAYPVLDPAQLAGSAAEAIRDILAAGASANTARSYRTALGYWAAWYRGRYARELTLPVPEPVVLQFIVDHLPRVDAEGTFRWELPTALDAALVAAGAKATPGAWKRSTVEHRLSVLASVHRLKDLPSPSDAPRVRQLLRSARRAAAQRGEIPAKKAALTRDPLEAMLATCGDDLAGLRDRALLLFGFASGGRRRSEIAQARVEQLQRLGPETWVFQLGRSKTEQAGPTAASAGGKPLVGRAAVALEAWLAASGITDGAVFRRLWGTRVGPSLSPAAVGALIQRRAHRAGLTSAIGGHSLRAGFVTEAGAQGVPLAEVMALTGHRSVASVIGYHRTGTATDGAAARLLEDRSPAAALPPRPS
jgi:integrase